MRNNRESRPKLKNSPPRTQTLEVGDDHTYSIAEVFPEYIGKERQIAIRAYRSRENLTQRQLAELTGIPQRHISEMENGKRAIGKELAKRLPKALNADYKVFLKSPSTSYFVVFGLVKAQGGLKDWNIRLAIK